ncbi:hypothetical protein PspR76_08385 [Pseudomonas sp. R76]|nr:hypothetical protein PspR76_08385 [Pseudomonas sp. R76]
MQVPAMVLGGAVALEVGRGGLWAMIERKLAGRTQEVRPGLLGFFRRASAASSNWSTGWPADISGRRGL